VLGPNEKLASVVRSKLLDIVVERTQERGASSTSDSLTAATDTSQPRQHQDYDENLNVLTARAFLKHENSDLPEGVIAFIVESASAVRRIRDGTGNTLSAQGLAGGGAFDWPTESSSSFNAQEL
jgi:hypothetical protein